MSTSSVSARMFDGFALASARITSRKTILAEGFCPEEGFAGWFASSCHCEPRQRDMHELFEIEVVLSGRVDTYAEGHHRPLAPGSIGLTAPWELHEWEVAVPYTRSLVLFLTPGFVGEESFDGTPWIDLFVAPARRRPGVATSQKGRLVTAIAKDIIQEMSAKEKAWVTGVRLGVMRLLLTLGRDWQPPGFNALSHSLRTTRLAQIAPAVKLLDQAVSERAPVKEAAEACSLSVAQFSHLFKLTMGLSYGRFALRSRLSRAAQLLLTTSLPVKTIAQELGFAHASHLDHAFTRAYGRTPSQFRAQGRWETPLSQSKPAS